jgi:hypothetical protein
MTDSIAALQAQIALKNYVIEQHKSALMRIGDALDSRNPTAARDIWLSMKSMVYKKETA